MSMKYKVNLKKADEGYTVLGNLRSSYEIRKKRIQRQMSLFFS
jgi:hypothetical protein